MPIGINLEQRPASPECAPVDTIIAPPGITSNTCLSAARTFSGWARATCRWPILGRPLADQNRLPWTCVLIARWWFGWCICRVARRCSLLTWV